MLKKYIKFCFQNFGNSREDRNGSRSTTSSIENEKKFNLKKIYWKIFFIIKTQISLSTSVFIYSTISEILKTKFYVFFGHKYVETGASCSHKLATFLKYYMPLEICRDCKI